MPSITPSVESRVAGTARCMSVAAKGNAVQLAFAFNVRCRTAGTSASTSTGRSRGLASSDGRALRGSRARTSDHRPLDSQAQHRRPPSPNCGKPRRSRPWAQGALVRSTPPSPRERRPPCGARSRRPPMRAPGGQVKARAPASRWAPELASPSAAECSPLQADRWEWSPLQADQRDVETASDVRTPSRTPLRSGSSPAGRNTSVGPGC